jgi:hypothetical protein
MAEKEQLPHFYIQHVTSLTKEVLSLTMCGVSSAQL